MPDAFSHFVFVDFENVPSVDLALIEGKPAHVTLLIGEKQKRLELALVRQIHRHATQVSLIEVGASGRNALDLVLAAHLGRATVEHPDAAFTIVSRDHDFDPLVAHLSANRVRITREPDFSALPLFGPAKRPLLVVEKRSAALRPAAAARKPAPLAAAPASAREDKLERLRAGLRTKTNRPKTRSSLLRHIHTAFGHKLSATEQEAVLTVLLSQKLFTIPDGKKVVYSS